jgi:hypothetical protein
MTLKSPFATAGSHVKPMLASILPCRIIGSIQLGVTLVAIVTGDRHTMRRVLSRSFFEGRCFSVDRQAVLELQTTRLRTPLPGSLHRRVLNHVSNTNAVRASSLARMSRSSAREALMRLASWMRDGEASYGIVRPGGGLIDLRQRFEPQLPDLKSLIASNLLSAICSMTPMSEPPPNSPT